MDGRRNILIEHLLSSQTGAQNSEREGWRPKENEEDKKNLYRHKE